MGPVGKAPGKGSIPVDLSLKALKHMDLNLKGVFLCAQAEARVMIPQKCGKIINTASMSGSVVNKPQSHCGKDWAVVAGVCDSIDLVNVVI